MLLTEILVPTFRQMLTTLSNWLTKAQTQLSEEHAEKLMSARIAPDMFPLATQIRFCCVQVHEAISRLNGEALTAARQDLLTEGRNAAEQPGSIADAQHRIAQAIALLENLGPGALDVNAPMTIAHELPNGMIFDLTADQYARDWALPQFYFHLMAAYAILRSGKIELGKADYVAHMFQYIRPGTMPAV